MNPKELVDSLLNEADQGGLALRGFGFRPITDHEHLGLEGASPRLR